MDEHCKELASPSVTNFCFSIVILLGILVSYLPQHYRIIALRSSFGISPYFVLLGTTAGASAFANILVLPRSANDITCCKEINGFSCFAALLGILQIGTQALSFAIILILFILYFPRATPMHVSKAASEIPSFRTAIIVVATCIFHAIVTTIFSLTVVVAYPSFRQLAANVLGIMAAILTSIQYFPQIYTTFRLKCAGSLSIPMMCMQTPGGFIWATSLAARLGPEGWSTWGLFLLTASMQGIVLLMAIYYEYINPQKGAADLDTDRQSHIWDDSTDAGNLADTEDRPASERTPLLRSSS
ncbi:hypothetical protein VTO42DRAFT_4793 [Malbranchea cinnamomea]